MKRERYHFIAIGGAVMHQLALHLHSMGHFISGSDDAIFDPAASNLKKQGLFPAELGWRPEFLSHEIDAVILGMHARADNPELIKAQELGLKIYSFPEFVFEHSKNKKRVVVAGSHGKTTTTSMIMHVLKSLNIDFDYLVGAQIEGFEYVVKISENAPLIVIEGDEYLTSPLDLRSKFLHYFPHIAIITGIAWDHINVFPTFEGYVDTFRKFVTDIKDSLIYFEPDEHLQLLSAEASGRIETVPYLAFENHLNDDGEMVLTHNNQSYEVSIFGDHNFANLKAAYEVCKRLEISDDSFFKHAATFKGAARRLELIQKNEDDCLVYKDFAHAPSKVKATVAAVRKRYPHHKLVAALELHTFSSLQQDFIVQYKDALVGSDAALVFVDEEALKLKKRERMDPEWLASQLGTPKPFIAEDKTALAQWIEAQKQSKTVYLFMSSGHWGGFDLTSVI